MKRFLLFTTIIVICAFLAGCNSLPAMPSGGQVQSTAGNPLTTGPVETIPLESNVEVKVLEKDPIYKTVDVVFAGGNGQVQVSYSDVKLTRSDGTSEIQRLNPEKGSTVTLQGTTGTDRVEVYVHYKSGKMYKIIDQLVPYRTRG